MNKATQERKILAFCVRKTDEVVIRFWITQRDAYKLGIYRLASRISDMKAKGYQIITEYIRVENADGTFSRIARYKILATPEETWQKPTVNFDTKEVTYAENVSF